MKLTKKEEKIILDYFGGSTSWYFLNVLIDSYPQLENKLLNKYQKNFDKLIKNFNDNSNNTNTNNPAN